MQMKMCTNSAYFLVYRICKPDFETLRCLMLLAHFHDAEGPGCKENFKSWPKFWQLSCFILFSIHAIFQFCSVLLQSCKVCARLATVFCVGLLGRSCSIFDQT